MRDDSSSTWSFAYCLEILLLCLPAPSLQGLLDALLLLMAQSSSFPFSDRKLNLIVCRHSSLCWGGAEGMALWKESGSEPARLDSSLSSLTAD